MTYHLPTLISVKSRRDVERDDLRNVQFGGLNNSRKVSFLTYGSFHRRRNPIGGFALGEVQQLVGDSASRGPSFTRRYPTTVRPHKCGLANLGSQQVAPPIGTLPMATPPIGLRAGSNRQVDRPSQFGRVNPSPSQELCLGAFLKARGNITHQAYPCGMRLIILTFSVFSKRSLFGTRFEEESLEGS